MGGGQHPHVGLDRLAGAHAQQRAFLQKAQQAGLRIERQVADLVEKHRAAVSRFEMADAPRICAGEGAALVPEQFGLHQIQRQRPAIDRHEGPLAAPRQTVQRARGHLLAAAGFAGDQHRQVYRRVLAQARHGCPHHRADRTDDPGNIGFLDGRRPAAADLRERPDQPLHVDRLGEEGRTGAQDPFHFGCIGGSFLHHHGEPWQPGILIHQATHGLDRIRIAMPQIGHGHHDVIAAHAYTVPRRHVANPCTPTGLSQRGALLGRRLSEPDDATSGYLLASHDRPLSFQCGSGTRHLGQVMDPRYFTAGYSTRLATEM
jgi:hypothetical protein